MTNDNKRWKLLFWCCFGLAAGTAFCMKWMETDLWSGNEKFTIIGLECTYTREKIMAIFTGLDDRTRTILRYHLSFDFAFMAGVYPGIAALCMLGRNSTSFKTGRNFLFILALLQTLAWGCDITENSFLFTWINKPVIGHGFSAYHIIVYTKWVLALSGAVTGLLFLLKRKRNVPA